MVENTSNSPFGSPAEAKISVHFQGGRIALVTESADGSQRSAELSFGCDQWRRAVEVLKKADAATAHMLAERNQVVADCLIYQAVGLEIQLRHSDSPLTVATTRRSAFARLLRRVQAGELDVEVLQEAARCAEADADLEEGFSGFDEAAYTDALPEGVVGGFRPGAYPSGHPDDDIAGFTP